MNSLLKPTDAQIIQQNKILMGSQSINLRAKQLIYVLASCINPESPHDEISISAKDFLDYINGDGQTKKWSDIYALTKEIFTHLNKNPILVEKPRSKDFDKINWLSRLGVSKGMINARFSTDIAEYFLYKQGLPYTKTMWDIRAYRSQYTARLLDLFQKHHIKESGKNEVEFEMPIESLKVFMGVHDKYPRMYDFERRVLKPSEKELKDNDDVPYWFEYDKIKQGREISAVTFFVHIRNDVLLQKVPNLQIFKRNQVQRSLFSEDLDQSLVLTKEDEKYIDALQEHGITENYALRVVQNLSKPQLRGYIELVRYGVNRNLAFNIIMDYCSIGAVAGFEDEYVAHALMKTEQARLKRIQDSQSGKTKKRTTPKEKRGGLAKKVFEERQYFPSFMDTLPKIKNKHEQADLRQDRVVMMAKAVARRGFDIEAFKQAHMGIYLDITKEINRKLGSNRISKRAIETSIYNACEQWAKHNL